MNTDELIERLARDARPVRPLARPATRAGRWLLVAVAYIAAGVTMMAIGLFPGAGSFDVLYLLQQGLALATGVFLAVAAFASVIPGAGRRVHAFAALSVSAWFGVLLWGCVRDVRATGTLGLDSHADWPCVAAIALGGGALWAAMAPMLRRGIPMTPRLTAWLGAGAALSLANVVACLTQPHAFTSIVVLWHGGTVVLLLAISSAAGPRVFREARS